MAYVAALVLITILLFAYILTLRYTQIKIQGVRIIAIIILVCFILVAYSAWFGNTGDLARYFGIMRVMQRQTLAQALTGDYYANTPLAVVIMYFVAQSENLQLLSAISCGVILLCVLCILGKNKKMLNSTDEDAILYLIMLVAVSTVAALLTSFRQQMTYAIMLLAVYRDISKKKRDWLTVFLYMCVIGMHTTGFMLVGLRVLSCLPGKWKWFILVWYIFIPFLNRFGSIGGLVGEGISKLNTYQSFEERLDIRVVMIKTVILILLAIVWNYGKKGNKIDKQYSSFFATLLLFAIGSLPVEHLYSRMVNVAVYFSYPLIVHGHRNTPKRNWSVIKYAFLILCGGLYAYHFVTLMNFFTFI